MGGAPGNCIALGVHGGIVFGKTRQRGPGHVKAP